MDFKNLFKEIKGDILSLVKDRFGKEGDQIKDDIAAFLENSKEQLQRWATLLEQGAITPAEFELLLNSQKDILIIESLHKAGISKIKIGMFKSAAVKLIVSKVITFALP